jgi:geranylgeranyl pyrophosphate synthase
LLDVSGSEDRMGKRLGKDESQGKTTYPRVLGVEASREYAAKLIDDACLALEGFGAEAEPLVELADFVRRRNN